MLDAGGAHRNVILAHAWSALEQYSHSHNVNAVHCLQVYGQTPEELAVGREVNVDNFDSERG